MSHHLIFEGAELAGKSWLMSQIYNYLEDKFGDSNNILNGCHWFNADVGIYGTPYGKTLVKNYLNIFKEIKEKNIIVEKFYISDIVYNKIYNQKIIDYLDIEKNLKLIDFKIIFIKFFEDKKLIQKRIEDRLNLYSHYKKILKSPEWYIKQQHLYEEEIKKTNLPVLNIETNILPDDSLVQKIIDWIG